MKGLTLAGLFAAISYALGYGIFIPKELEAFKLIAAASAMGGFGIGSLVAQKLKSIAWKAALIILAMVTCVGVILTYVIRVQVGAADISDIVILGILVATLFFSLWFLLPIAGVVANDKKKEGSSEPA